MLCGVITTVRCLAETHINYVQDHLCEHTFFGFDSIIRAIYFILVVPKKATRLFENNKETNQLTSLLLPLLNC